MAGNNLAYYFVTIILGTAKEDIYLCRRLGPNMIYNEQSYAKLPKLARLISFQGSFSKIMAYSTVSDTGSTEKRPRMDGQVSSIEALIP